MAYDFKVDLIFSIIFAIEIILNFISFKYEVARKETYIIFIIALLSITLISKFTNIKFFFCSTIKEWNILNELFYLFWIKKLKLYYLWKTNILKLYSQTNDYGVTNVRDTKIRFRIQSIYLIWLTLSFFQHSYIYCHAIMVRINIFIFKNLEIIHLIGYKFGLWLLKVLDVIVSKRFSSKIENSKSFSLWHHFHWLVFY